MRLTFASCLLVLAGAVAFAGAIIGVARVLPSDDAGREAATYATAAGDATPQVLSPGAADGAPSAPALGAPPASRPLDAPLVPETALDFRPLDLTMRDRYGNPPKSAATPAELQRIAAGYDIIVDGLRWQPDGAALDGAQIAALKAANPRVRVLRYVGALTSNDGPIFDLVPDDGTHGSWFLRDGSGDFVRAYEETAPWNGKPSYALDPSSIDVRNTVAAYARQFAALGYDGVLLDGVSACVPAPGATCAASALLSHPIDKTTNRPYADAAWLAATAGLLEAVRHVAPAARVFLDAAAGDQTPLLPHIDGILLLSP